jgi:cell division protein FtsI/penicillin-binding protein 2
MVTALKTVVSKQGTGGKAVLEHYTVAGKTGTAQKAGVGGYLPGKYVASFIGFFPADEPELCIGVFLDEPQHGYYGGQVAAPFFKTMAEQVAQYLSIRPDREPGTNTVLAVSPVAERVLTSAPRD